MKLSNSDRDLFLSLLDQIKVTPSELDEFLVSNPHIYRSVRGHAFEVWFDREMAERGFTTETEGGDSVVDRKLNGRTLQLKTPYLKSIVDGKIVGYRMHKTHGAEVYPLALYKKEEFADYFVGLHPTNGVIICPKDRLVSRAEVNPKLKHGEYVTDPLLFSWNTEWLNRYDLLGIDNHDYPTVKEHTADEAEYLPRLISKIGFTDYDIIKSIIDPQNFRIWNQLIVGSIREFHFQNACKKINLKLLPAEGFGGREDQKIDFMTESGLKIQVKGLTKGLCKKGLLGCETQCSHSRQPIRLYKRTDFDILGIVIDPGSIDVEVAKKMQIDPSDYNFLILPMSRLPLHPKSQEWGEERIKPSFIFDPVKEKLNNFQLLFEFPIRNN